MFLEIKKGLSDRDTLTALTTNIINETNYDFEVSFPWPRGVKNLTHAEVTLPDGSKENIYFWAIIGTDSYTRHSAAEVRVIFKGAQYGTHVSMSLGPPKKYSIVPTETTKVVFKVVNNKIEEIKTTKHTNLNGAIGSSRYFGSKSVFIFYCISTKEQK